MSAGRAVTFWVLWLIVTQVGVTVGYGLSLIAAITLLDSKTNQEPPLLMLLVAMFFVPVGGLQWLVLRACFPWAKLWAASWILAAPATVAAAAVWLGLS